MFAITDATAGTQRFAVDNSQNTEIGSATPSSELSVNGHAILSGAVLAQQVAAPASMPRTTGAISLASGISGTVSAPTQAGFASIDGPGTIVAFNSDLNQFTVLGTSTGGAMPSMNYASF